MYSPELNSLLNRELIMENRFIDKVKDNVVVRIWSEKTQQEKSDNLTKRYMLELWDFTCISYWNPSYSHFTFGKVDLVPTVEDYTTLLHCPRIQADKTYSRAANIPTFLNRLMGITRMSEQWVAAQIKQKEYSKCIPWKNLPDLILAHPDTKKRVDVFALNIYGLIVKQDFEKRSLKLERKIEKLEEEKIQLGLDIGVQKLEVEKMRKGKNKVDEDFDSLKIDYKKLCLSMRTVGLEDALERYLLENRDEKVGLKARVTKLERSLHQYRSCNSIIELKVSLNKIDELKGKIEEFKIALQNCELRVELLETNIEHWKEQLQRS
ncbi:hypothetical protein Golob_024122 [Gossypium lobatum]|uniref:DUF7745 domain-containing protein n=1 Tax=Gossypium lobatum TaxID=34289 RepID=A0A7J8NJC4_9ROSI|nr:hypothetical protein [Gossypium lobatum]